MTTHQHPKFGTVTVIDDWWNRVTAVSCEGAQVDCQLVNMSAETPAVDVTARLDLLASVIDGLDGYVTQAREALEAQFATSEKFAPWVKSLRRTLAAIIGLSEGEEITAQNTAAVFRLTHILVQKDPRTEEYFNPEWNADFELELSLTYLNEKKSYDVKFNRDGDVIGIGGPSTSSHYSEDTEEVAAPNFTHDVLGHCDGDELPPINIGGKAVEVWLYMSGEQLKYLQPSDLDIFVPLVARIDEFDKIARAAVPAETSDYFHDLWDDEDYRKRVQAAFPDMKGPDDAKADQIEAAIWPNHITLSLDLSGSGGAALSIDYKLLPEDEELPEDNVFCASFAPDGKFLGIAQES